MNRFTRLTALLLAMLMIFSTFATAEGYQVGEMSQENWNQIVTDAKTILETPVIVEGEPKEPAPAQPGNTQPYQNTVAVQLGDNAEMSTADLAVVTAAQADQWQIAYTADVWVNIANENGATLNVNASMLQGTAMAVRQVKSDDVTTFTLNEASVSTAQSDAAAFTVESREGTTADEPLTIEEANPDVEANKFGLQINYVTQSGVAVASSYTASFVNGSSYTATVKHPEVKGYTPKLSTTSGTMGVTLAANNEDDKEVSVTYSFTNLTPNGTIKIKVVYEPIDVTYVVNHYQQNANDNEYTLHETETKYGKTESTTEAKAKTYDGFYALLFEQPEIAADGKTTVNIYYDRHYYLMQFVLGDGGYGVEPIYARYDADIGDVGAPTRPGYTFKGWTTEPNATVYTEGQTLVTPETTMPLNGATYYAVWEMGDSAKVNIVFYGQNPNDDGYSYLQTGEVMAKPGTEYTYTHGTQTYLYCELPEHNHATSGCTTICGKTEHTTHTEDCLGNCDHPTHTLDCYSAGSYSSNIYDYQTELRTCNQPSGVATPSLNGIVTSGNNKYLYIDGTWYCGYYYKPTDIGGSRGWKETPTIDIEIACSHTHSTTCYNCEYHEHIDACYDCGLEEHTHTSTGAGACTGTVAGLNSTLWKFKSSETATVEADGSTTIKVYYDRTTFTLHFRKKNSNSDDYGTIQKRWGSNIETEFEAKCELAGYDSWSENRDATSPWTNYLAVMPQENRTYYSYTGSGNNVWTMTYYKETFTDGEYAVAFTVELHRSGNTTVSKEEFIEIEGFTFNADKSTKTGSYTNGAKFYYDRHAYHIEFYNPTDLIKKSEPIYYQASISNQDFTPGDEWIPDQYAPGSVRFEGWYQDPQCAGEKYDFTDKTMPVGTKDGDTTLVLYANWVPVTRTVTFYIDLATMEDPNGEPLKTVTVPHGSKLTEEQIPTAEQAGYTFVGWFYIEDGKVNAFDFANMPVNKDLTVYAQWTSDTMVPYRVKYIYVEDGVEYNVAADTTGSALGGSTKTFEAKVGGELYEKYQTGYFPSLTRSHNVEMVINEVGGVVQEVVYTFEYFKRDAVPYVVYYVTEQQNDENPLDEVTINGKTYYQLLNPHVVDENDEAIVTEAFQVVNGYMPDAAQKSLVLNPEIGDSVAWLNINGVQVHPDNVIVFVYSEDATHAYYVYSYYIQELDGSYTLYAREDEQVGVVNNTYNNKPLTTVPEGFEYARTDVCNAAEKVNETTTEKTVSAKLTAEGLEFKHYYDRVKMAYVVYYYKQGTTIDVYPNKKVENNMYGSTVTEEAVDLDPAYRLVSTNEKSITISTTESENVIIFEYDENVVTIAYVPVGLVADKETGALTSSGETIKAITGTPTGSTANEVSGYTFKGWYTDEACTIPVTTNDGTVTNTTFVPEKEAATEKLPQGYYSDATFYALYTENTATITYQAVYKDADGNLYLDATGGTVDVLDNATPAGAKDSETVTVVTGAVAGATADPKDNYEFLGWFTKDDNGKYVAIEENGGKLEYLPVQDGVWQDTTYYALFELDVADLTITKVVVGAPAGIAKQEFAITVSLPEKAEGYAYIKTLADKSTQEGTLTTNGGTLNIKNGETIVIKDVAIGSNYSVTENESSYFDVNGEVENAKIANGENKVNLINTYKSGQLSITKTVQATENVDVSKAEFTFKVELTPAVTGNFDYTVNDSTNKNTAEFTDGVAKIKLKAGETATFETLPNGVSYTVEEIGIPSGYALDEATNNSQSGEITMGKPSATTFTNIHQYGDLVISKTVSGADAPGGTFMFTVNLSGSTLSGTYGNASFQNGTATIELKVAKGETRTEIIPGLPAGTTYTVTEAAVPGYTTTITEATTTPGSIDPAGTDIVTFANEYKTGILTIKKKVTTVAGVNAPEKDFAFIVTLKDASGNALTGSYAYTIDNGGTGGNLSSGDTITLKHDQTATFGKLPDSVTFEVKEAKNDDYVTTATPNGSAVDGGYKVSGTISADNVQAVEFTNFYNYGNLTITKNVEGAPADLTEQEEFNVQISGLTDGTYSVARSAQSATETLTVSGGKGTLTIKHGETLVIENIKDGTKVTVTEIDVPSYYEAAPASGSVTIDADATDRSANTVAITNTYKSGSLTITKTVVGVTAPDQEFTFIVDIDGMTLADNFAYTVATANVEGTTSGEIVDGGQLTLKNGQTATISGLPVGVNCTVTEQAIVGNPYTTEVKVNDGDSTTASAATVAIPESGAGAVEFINTYQYSDLKISKTVVKNTDFTPAVNAFVFTVQLSGASVPDKVTYIIDKTSYTATVDNAGQFNLTLTNSQTATIKNLPAGTTYTVTEAEVPGYTTTITKNSATVAEATGAIVAGAQTVDEVVFTNEYKVGSLEVTKEVNGGDAPKGEEFTFTLTLEGLTAYPANATCAIGDKTETIHWENGSYNFQLQDGETAKFNGLPDGVTYKVEETVHSDYTPSATPSASIADGKATVTGTINATTSGKVEFTNTYKYSHLTIKKTGMKAGESAIFTVTCDGKTYTVVVPNEKEIVIGKLPIGETYTITEIGDWTWLYANPTYQHSNSEHKIIEGGSRVDVTNKGTDKWLHDESGVINNLGTGTNTAID